MIDVKIIKKPKGNSNTGRIVIAGKSYSIIDEAKHAFKADKAGQAERADHAEGAEFANRSGYASRSAYSDKAQNLTEDSPVRDLFLSKITPDTAQERITFQKGIQFGDEKTIIDEHGIASLAIVLSTFGYVVGDYAEGTSGAILADKDGHTYLEVDRAYFRQKAVFENLEVIKTQYSYGNRIVGKGGVRITRVENKPNAYRCYYKNELDGLKIKNPFVVNDQAIVKEWNIKEGTAQHAANHYLWRMVVAVGDGYVDLSKTVCDTGSDAPLPEDNLCQLGYRGTDKPDRQCAIMEQTAGENVPAYVMLQGISDFTLEGKDMLSFGWDNQKQHAFLRVYGETFIGERNKRQYIEYTPKDGLVIKAKEVTLHADGTETNIGEQIKETNKSITQLSLKQGEIDLSVKEASAPRNLLTGTAFRFDKDFTQNNVDYPCHVSETERYKGTNSVVVDINEANAVYSGIILKSLVISPGISYTFSFLSKTVAGHEPDTFYYEVQAFKKDGSQSVKYRLAGGNVHRSEEWARTTSTFVTAEDVNYIKVIIFVNKSGKAYIARPMLEEGDKYTGWTLSPNDDIKAMQGAGVNVNKERIELNGKTVFKNGNASEVPLFGEDGKVNPNLSAAQYLMEILKSMETVIDGGLVMAGLIAAKDGDGNVISYLNGLQQKMYALAAGVKNFGKADETSMSHIGFDGSAKFGHLGIASDGRVSIIDKDSKPRVNITPDELPEDAVLLKSADADITLTLPNMTVTASSWQHELTGGMIAVANDNSYITLTGRLLIEAFVNNGLPDGSFASPATLALKLRNAQTGAEVNLNYWAFASSTISHGQPAMLSDSTDIRISRILPAGKWYVIMVAHRGTNVHDESISLTNIQANILHKSGAQSLSLAHNGWSVVQSGKQAVYVRDGKLCAFGAMNIPGILLAGTVSRYGQLSNAWGEFAAGTGLIYTSSGGLQVIRLKFNKTLPCGANYVAIVNPNDDTSPYGCMPVVRKKTATYCDFRVVNDSGGDVTNVGLDFMIIGRNK